MSWIFLAEPENSAEPSKRLWNSTASPAGQPRIVSASDTRREYFFPECFVENSTSPQSAPTSANSNRKASHPSTPSSEASPARISAQRAVVLAWKASEADFSLRCSGSPASLDLDSSDWKMSQQLLFGGGCESLPSLPRWGITRAGELWALTISAERIGGTDGGAWPSPRAEDSESCGAHGTALDSLGSAAKAWRTPDAGAGGPSGRLKKGETHCPNGQPITMRLDDQVSMWLTPRANDPDETAEDFSKRMGDRSLDCFGSLTGQAKGWPTPSALDFRSAGTPEGYQRRTQKGHQQPLSETACHRGPRLQAMPWHGVVSLRLLLKLARLLRPPHTPEQRRRIRYYRTKKLNPLFVEWLLGSSFGMTELEPLAMAWIMSARGKRSKSCSAEKKNDK